MGLCSLESKEHTEETGVKQAMGQVISTWIEDECGRASFAEVRAKNTSLEEMNRTIIFVCS